jgi:hypothetical protein
MWSRIPPRAIARSVHEDHVTWFALTGAHVLAQQKQQLARPGKLGAPPNPPRRASKATENLQMPARAPLRRDGIATALRAKTPQPLGDRGRRLLDLVALFAPDARDLFEDIDEARLAPLG